VKLFALALIFFSASTAFAKGGVTGEDGGHGVLCRTKARMQGSEYYYTLEVLDLFEARRVRNMHAPEPSSRLGFGEYDGGSICALLKFKKAEHPELNLVVRAAFDQACELAFKIQNVEEVDDTGDFGKVRTPLGPDCSLVQIANRIRDESGEHFQIKDEFAAYLNDNDVAALLFHEVLHKYSNAKTTLPIRKLVGQIFIEQN
jgi:hypothetical protein